jgi:putative endopeptidase
MPKTYKNKHSKKHNNTKKLERKSECSIGLKPFEEDFSKNISKKSLIKSNSEKKKEFVKELTAKFAPHSIKPNDNFYDYINYLWLKNVSLENQQKYIVQVDDFRLAQDKVYHQLNEIILDYIKNNNNKLASNLKNYYQSIIEMNPKNYTIQLAKNAVLIVEKLISENNPWAMLAHFNRDEMLKINAPFQWAVNPDEKNNKVYRCYITSGQFSLLDINVYFDDNTDVEYKKKYRNEFNKYVKKIFDTLLGLNHNYNPQDVYDVEVQILDALGCIDVKLDEVPYNKVFAEEAINKYGFDWREFSKQLGYKKTPQFFITPSLNYLKCGSELLINNWNTDKWKTFWLFNIFKCLIRITRDWEDIIYDFKGKFERGQEAKNETDAVSASLYMSIPFNTFLTNEYVRKYENPEAVKYVETMANDLKIVFKRIIIRNKWLSPATKKYALLKLKHCKFIFSKPDNLREDPDLSYGKLLYDNMKKINDWRYKKFIELEGKSIIDIPQMDWGNYPVKLAGEQAYIVNASYTPSKNRIYINLGYIQKPFVDLDERGIEYNLAHVGFTIAHELGHGFDDWGSQYGWDGNLYNWWTSEDKKKYKQIQNDVIKQYEEFAARDGIKFDASIGVGEDLADIQSLAICDEYLRDFQEKNQDLVPIRYLGFEAFYTYFAFQQRQFVSKKALSAQLKTNPHPLDKYRCNIPLSRSEIFRAIYDVKKGDGMYWHNTNTVW